MRYSFILLAYVIAGITFCLGLANATIFIAKSSELYICFLSSIANIGIFVTSLAAALFAVLEYNRHKQEQRTKLLCEYNQRYSTDRNIESIIEWMLQIALTNDEGDIIGVNKNIKNNPPGIHKKEMFMRFFEELYMQIKDGRLNENNIKRMFSYYALRFATYEDFRSDIKDYEKDEWSDFREFVKLMKE